MRLNLSALGRALFAIGFVFVVFLLFEQTHRIALNAMRALLADWKLDWHRDPLAMALDRLCYGIFLSGAGWLLFRRLLPGARAMTAASARRTEDSAMTGLLVGALSGVMLFAAIAGMHQVLVYLKLQPTPQRGALSAALDAGPLIVLYHLIFTAAITAILEEVFFRGSLQAFLESRDLPPAIAIAFPALLFGMVHPVGVWPALLGVGLAFGFLFWRYGLGSAILAHAVYNALLLLSRFLFQE
ncbi:MAG: CPBP family intramembrane metalloprotease [bacterium]|nr:CPBP family intramembrane metalloprotease [bacterium]